MRVMYLIKNFSLGGGPRAVYYLCLSMPKVEFFIYGENGLLANDFKQLDNVHIYLINKWNLKSIFKIKVFYENEKIDIIHFHSLIPAVYFIFFTNMVKIITFHGLHIRKYDYKKNFALRFFRQITKNLLVCSFQASIVLCLEDKIYLQRLLWCKKNLEIIPNAFCLSKVEKNTEIKLDRSYLNLIMVARYDFQKGYDLLLEMLEKPEVHINKLRIYFIGNIKVDKLLRQYGDLYNKVLFYLGETTEPYGYIQRVDYLVLPSRWEGLPMVVLEALAVGTKVIAADTANINSMADNRNIFIYKQSDSKDFNRIIKKCVKYKYNKVNFDLSPYTLQNVGDKTFALYQKLRNR